VFFYDVGATTVANRFDLTNLVGHTANGNGVVTDPIRLAGCELQTVGGAAGFVVCAIINAQGGVQYGYVFHFGLDQTYDGFWLAADGMTTHPMKGFKVVSRSGSINKHAKTLSAASMAEASETEATAGAAIQAAVEAMRRVLPTP